MKILLCSPLGNTGGIARWTSHILDYYKEEGGRDVDLKWCYAAPSKKDILVGSGVLSRLYWGFRNYLPFIRTLRKELKNNRYDVVHFTSSASIGLLRDLITLRLCRRKGIPSVVHFRFGRIPQLYRSQNWERKLLHRVLSRSDRAVVIDRNSYDVLLAEGYRNIALLPNPLTPKVGRIVGRHPAVSRKARTILFAGQVIPTKGVFELVEVCRHIPDIELRMIGICTDKMKESLLSLAGSGCEAWLTIVGDQPFGKVIEEMLAAGLFVLPTYTEGFPNVILESMACGCPIVTTSVGAIPEMLDIHSETPCGICVEPQNTEELREAVERLLSDAENAAAMGERAKQRVNRQYSMPAVWADMVGIWKDVIKDNC